MDENSLIALVGGLITVGLVVLILAVPLMCFVCGIRLIVPWLRLRDKWSCLRPKWCTAFIWGWLLFVQSVLILTNNSDPLILPTGGRVEYTICAVSRLQMMAVPILWYVAYHQWNDLRKSTPGRS